MPVGAGLAFAHKYRNDGGVAYAMCAARARPGALHALRERLAPGARVYGVKHHTDRSIACVLLVSGDQVTSCI